ncbi:MAG: hypothetical protein H6656_04495 [Ardenticatenaceae bacterium]|nr:hypothetical protein [Ardenticatenaceae bacterium]
MKSTLTASDVLADIEFELMQGAISRDAFGRGLQEVRQRQNKIRQELFDSGQQEIDLRAALAKQFQINDMLLTLLQEMSGGFEEMQQQINWVGQARRGDDQSTAARLARAQSGTPGGEMRPTKELSETAQPDFLQQQMDIQPNGRPIPILNGLIRRLRSGLHSLAIFYVNKLGERQTAVNQIQADWIQYLNAQVRHQQEELEQLMQQVTALQNKSTPDE